MPTLRLSPTSSLSVLMLLAACGEKETTKETPNEGTAAGDCTDGADNDADGTFDCADDGCAGSPDCATADENAAPSGAAIAIEPAAPADSDNLSCVIVTEATDPNGDAVTYHYAWTVDGADAGITESTVAASLTSGGQTWTCTITPTDGTLDGSPSSASATVAFENRAPSSPTVSISPSAPTDDDVLTCVIDTESVDPDGDAITYSYAWSVDGVDAGLTTAAVNAALTEAGQAWTCTVTASDGALESSSASASVDITAACVPGEAACPAASCQEILEAGVATSGAYWIDTDAGSAQVMCEMDTEGGGWTPVFVADQTDYSSESIDYTLASDTIRSHATEVLIGFVNADGLYPFQWAMFDIPSDWVLGSPMQVWRGETSVDALLSNGSHTTTTLYYGYSNYNGDCGSWISRSYGRVGLCVANAPKWQAWAAAPTEEFPGDYCNEGDDGYFSTPCTDDRRFAIFVR